MTIDIHYNKLSIDGVAKWESSGRRQGRAIWLGGHSTIIYISSSSTIQLVAMVVTFSLHRYTPPLYIYHHHHHHHHHRHYHHHHHHRHHIKSHDRRRCHCRHHNHYNRYHQSLKTLLLTKLCPLSYHSKLSCHVTYLLS